MLDTDHHVVPQGDPGRTPRSPYFRVLSNVSASRNAGEERLQRFRHQHQLQRQRANMQVDGLQRQTSRSSLFSTGGGSDQ